MKALPGILLLAAFALGVWLYANNGALNEKVGRGSVWERPVAGGRP